MTLTRRQALTEALIVWALAIATARLCFSLRNYLKEYTNLVTTGIFIVFPVLISTYRKESADFFERNWKDFFASLKLTGIVSLLIFPLMALLNHYYQGLPLNIHYGHFEFWKRSLHYHPAISYAPLLSGFVNHLLMAAFPEEFFFRGYLLRRFRQVFQDRFTFLGVLTGKAFFLTAFLFAVSHSLIIIRWWHFAIFFPALVFGWLREKSGALTAPILFHALSNTFSLWVGMHYW